MKQEATKKPKKLLWLWIGLAALVLIAGAVLGAILLFGGEKGSTGPVGGRPDLYWNLDKEFYTKDSETGLSTREAGEDGVFRVRFAYNGEQVELPVVDKQLVNYIDTMDVVGIVKDADGVVVDVLPVEDVATPVAQNAYVQQVMGDKIIANSSIAMNGLKYTIELSDLTQMYDVSESADVAGQIIDGSALQAMDSIWVFANDMEEVTHIYMTDHPTPSAVYWRAYQMWNSTEKATSRVPDENGVYSIDFCSDGNIVTLKCKDKSIVSTIDNRSPHSCHFGFVFDEEGYIIEIMNSGIGIRGAVAAERVEVQELDGNYFSGTQLIPSDTGLSYSATLPEDCIIYDASSSAARDGRQGKQVDSLKLGDRVCVWTDPVGTPVLVYIANRLVDCDAYYNLSRSYDGTKQETKREPDWAGYYTFEMVKTGETGKKTLKTKDKELATFIDSIANRVVGLKVENGIILNAYVDDDVYGWSSVWGGYVSQLQGTIASLVGFSDPDSPINVLMNMGYKVYDVSGKDVPYGTETTLRVGDIATVARDVSYNGVVVYVSRRMVGGDDNVYYNLDYQFNSTTKETNRVPDEEGYYVFKMAHKGKQVTVKTKNKELANKIDQSPIGDLVVVMRVVDGIAYEVYDTEAAYGQVIKSGYRIKSVNGDGTYTLAGITGIEYVLKMADDCIIYNVSTVYDSHRGERCYSLKPGDMVTSLADYRSDIKLIYVRQRSTDNIYVNKQRMYDSVNKVTLREPDADGYYWFELAVDGQLKKFKTKSKDMASQVDAYSTPFGARIDGDVILNVTGANYAGRSRSTVFNGWDVTSVSKWSVSAQFNKVGYANTGEKKTVNLSSNVSVFDISPTAEQFGQKVELKKGDRVLAYADIDGNICYIFVLFHDSRVKGSVAYCEHCNKEVRWHPWAGGTWDAFDGHYYLAGNVQYSGQSNIGSQNKNYEIVLDLNGCTFNAIGSRGALIRFEDALSIIDSVGGGEFAATGTNGNGGTFLITESGIMNLYSGTLSFIDSEDAEVSFGAVAYINSGSVVNMYGGTIKGGIVNSSTNNVFGGNLGLRDSVFNMYGGVIEEGQAIRNDEAVPAVAAQGGNLYAYKNSVINLYEGAEIRNGYSNQHGGNIYLSTATLNLLGGKIYGGECRYSGGNLYNQFAGVVNVTAGTMENGKAGAEGDEIYAYHDTGVLNFTGGTVNGNVRIVNCASVSLSGTPKVTELSLASGIKADFSGLKKGASVGVLAEGVFSTEMDNAATVVKYVQAAESCKDVVDVVAMDNVLVAVLAQSYLDKHNSVHTLADLMTANDVFASGGDVVASCPVCDQEVTWKDLNAYVAGNGNYTIKNAGHYYLSDNINIPTSGVTGAHIGVYANACVHLNGKNITSAERAFYVDATDSIMRTLNIMGEGTVSGAGLNHVSIPRGTVDVGGTVNFYGGTYTTTGSNPAMTGRGFMGRSVVNVYDGATFDASNVSLLVQSQGVNLYGGEVVSGTIKVNGATGSALNVYGGVFTDPDEIINAFGQYANLNIAGGTFVDGNVYVGGDLAEFTILGAPVISSLDLTSGKVANIIGLKDGASIGVFGNGQITAEHPKTKEYLNNDYIKAINGQVITVKDNALFVERAKQYCAHCDKEVYWDSWTGTSPASGHYKLFRDYNNQIAQIAIVDGTDVVLDLAGYKYNTDNIRNFLVRGKFSIVDSVGGGEMIATGNASCYGSIAILPAPDDAAAAAPELNLYAGTFRLADIHKSFGVGGVIRASAGTINVYEDAIISGGEATVSGGNIALEADATLNVFGGKILGGVAPQGGSVDLKGTLNVENGTIDGEVLVHTGATATVSGVVEIGTLNIQEDVLVDVSGLETGSQIAVKASGVFTKELDNAENYLAYFKKLSHSDCIGVQDNALAIVPLNVVANKMTEDDVFASGGDVEALCPVCDEVVTWQNMNSLTTADVRYSPASGHYYLSDDMQRTARIDIGGRDKEVCLHLNGHNITNSVERVMYVEFSTVNIMGSGVVTGGFAHSTNLHFASTIDSCGNVNLFGGTYKATTDRPIITARLDSASTLTMYDGASIVRDASSPGLNVQVHDEADFIMYGGVISGASRYGVNGGNVFVNANDSRHTPVFTMYGGVIEDGIADLGGNIYAKGKNAVVNLCGGTIKNGDVYVEVDIATVSVSGTPVIDNLDLSSGKILTVDGLAEGADIRVTANGAFTDALSNANDVAQFFSASSDEFEFAVVNNKLTVRQPINMEKLNGIHEKAEKMTADGVFDVGGEIFALCPVCDQEVVWQDLNALNSISSAGHYYLSDDMQRTALLGVYYDACLHLNGHNITSPSRAIYAEYITLNIMGEGVVTGGKPHNTHTHFGSAIDAPANVNLYGGTYTSTSEQAVIASRSDRDHCISFYDGASIVRDSSNPGLNLRLQDNGDFKMFGGVISGGYVAGNNGGNVLVNANSTNRGTTFTMYGGLIENGTADLGGNIYATGKNAVVNIMGGTIQNGDVYVESAVKEFSVSGAPVISELDLTNGKKLIVGDLVTGANITVYADGVFTEENEFIANYLDFFKTSIEGKKVKTEGNTLAVANA